MDIPKSHRRKADHACTLAFSVRMKEHQRAAMTRDIRNANAVHSGREGHWIDWGNDNARI